MKDAIGGTPARRALSPKVQMAAQGSEAQIQLPPSWPGETSLSAASQGLEPRLLSGETVDGIISFPFMAESYSFVYVYRIFFIHLLMDT